MAGEAEARELATAPCSTVRCNPCAAWNVVVTVTLTSTNVEESSRIRLVLSCFHLKDSSGCGVRRVRCVRCVRCVRRVPVCRAWF